MLYDGYDYTGYFDWNCPNCEFKNSDEVEYANMFTCIYRNCNKEYEIHLEIEININRIIEY